MILDRSISLLLSAALVACPVVCRAGGCNDCPAKQAKHVGCSHCLAAQNGTGPSNNRDLSGHLPTPVKKTHCELGNCLCAGAVTSGGGIDLQIGHELGVFSACDVLCEHVQSSNSPAIDLTLANRDEDPLASGWRLRLRIESLLI